MKDLLHRNYARVCRERPPHSSIPYYPFVFFQPPADWANNAIVLVYEELDINVPTKDIIKFQKKINKNQTPECPLFPPDKIRGLHFIRPSFAQVTVVHSLHRVRTCLGIC